MCWFWVGYHLSIFFLLFMFNVLKLNRNQCSYPPRGLRMSFYCSLVNYITHTRLLVNVSVWSCLVNMYYVYSTLFFPFLFFYFLQEAPGTLLFPSVWYIYIYLYIVPLFHSLSLSLLFAPNQTVYCLTGGLLAGWIDCLLACCLSKQF